MIKKIKNKLRSPAGESIGETLAALLIAALALTMLAGAVTASAKVVDRSRDTLDAYYSAQEGLTKKQAGKSVELPDKAQVKTDGAVSFKVKNGELEKTITKNVTFYENTVFGKSSVIWYK